MESDNTLSRRPGSTGIYIDAHLPLLERVKLQERAFCQVRVAHPIAELESVERPSEDLRAVEILLCTYLPKNLDDMRSLQFVQLASSGYTQAEGLSLPARGVRVCNARGVNDTAIAEWNVAMMICLARNMKQLLKNQERRVWDRATIFQTEIRGATVGIWGYGGIGRQTARLCKGLGLQVHVLSRSPVTPIQNVFCVPDSGDSLGTLPDCVFLPNQRFDFLRSLDFLVLCLPLNAETKGVVSEKELEALPKTAFVLNPSRGHLIEEESLLQALRNKSIAGVALDTHYEYPLPPNHPLWDFDTVIITPHISGSSGSPHFQSRLAQLFRQNVDCYLNGGPLLNEIPADCL